MKQSRIFRGDRTIWVLFLLLSIFSLVEVYSSIGLLAYSGGGGEPTKLFFKHLLIVLVSWCVVIVTSRINYRYFSRFALLGYWVSLVLLGVMLMLGGRWMSLPLINQFQPSEVAKVVLILFVARYLALNKDKAEDLGTFLVLLIIIGAVVILVLPENFSTAALIGMSCFVMMLFGGVKRSWWWRMLLVALAGVVIGLAVTYNRYERSLNKENAQPTEQLLERSSTWGHRVYTWINPVDTVLTQENMAKMAVARGGIIGKGPGSTVHARLMTQAHNDFIYAIIIEETGMVGGLVVFLLYSFLYFQCMRISWRCKGQFGSLAVAGMGTVIYFQAMANMCVAVGVLPVTGQTLPFISYGGTAYLLLCFGLGVVQAVAADVNRDEEERNSNPELAADEVDKTDSPARVEESLERPSGNGGEKTRK